MNLEPIEDKPIYCINCGGIKYHPNAINFTSIQIEIKKCKCNIAFTERNNKK